MRTRQPAVAGSFYAALPDELEQQVAACFLHSLGPGKLKSSGTKAREIVAAVLPHAGYMFSGPVAAWGYQALSEEKKPAGVVLLGPDHHARGDQVSVPEVECFRTPLADFPVPQDWVEAALKCPVIHRNNAAHQAEHSLEVQLPFLAYLYGSLPILPMTYYAQQRQVAEAVAAFLLDFFHNKDILVIASSDCSHYIPEHEAREKDNKVLEYVVNLNREKFYQTIMENKITFCGYGPIATAMAFAQGAGYAKGQKLAYATSGDTGGGRRDVVGYAAVIFSAPQK